MLKNRTQSPFLKWAGGKRWLVERHAHIFPKFEGRYIEPFLGGGSVFFHLTPTNGILSDTNSSLIECYQQIKDDHEGIVEYLQAHQELHNPDYYYEIRSSKYDNATERAAQFLYLNRTCWNGLYRVNLKGTFNVPIGTKSKVIDAREDFSSISNTLKSVELKNCDFEDTINLAEKDDFIFIDPPYTIKHNFNGFLKYNEKIFSWDDQVRLKNAIIRATDRGAKILVTNAAHSSIYELYEGLGKLRELNRKSVLAGKKEARKNVQEILLSI